jgi:hypothetical protein
MGRGSGKNHGEFRGSVIHLNLRDARPKLRAIRVGFCVCFLLPAKSTTAGGSEGLRLIDCRPTSEDRACRNSLPALENANWLSL